MPKQISNKIILPNNLSKLNSNQNNSKENNISNINEKSSNIQNNFISSPNQNIKRSGSKKNLINSQQSNSNNHNSNNVVYIPENIKSKKLETINTTSSYISTPVINKEKEKNMENKTRYINFFYF